MSAENEQKGTSYEKVPLFVGKLCDSSNGRVSDVYSHPIAFASLEDAVAEMQRVKMADNICLEEVRLSGYYLAVSGRVEAATEEDLEKNIWRKESHDEKKTK